MQQHQILIYTLHTMFSFTDKINGATLKDKFHLTH